MNDDGFNSVGLWNPIAKCNPKWDLDLSINWFKNVHYWESTLNDLSFLPPLVIFFFSYTLDQDLENQ